MLLLTRRYIITTCCIIAQKKKQFSMFVTTLRKNIRNVCWMPCINAVLILGPKLFLFSTTHTPAAGTATLPLSRFCEYPSPAVETSVVLKLIARFHLMQGLRTTAATLLIHPRAVTWHTATVENPFLRASLVTVRTRKALFTQRKNSSAFSSTILGSWIRVSVRNAWILAFFTYFVFSLVSTA